MPSPIVRTGRQRTALAADAVLAAELLADPVAVTSLLGDLLDQRSSSPGPPPRWVIPPVNVGLRSLRTVLVPTLVREATTVVVDAPSAPESDVRAGLRLELDLAPERALRSTLVTTWRIELSVPLSRPALLLARPAIDAVVDRTVRSIQERSRIAVEAAQRAV